MAEGRFDYITCECFALGSLGKEEEEEEEGRGSCGAVWTISFSELLEHDLDAVLGDVSPCPGCGSEYWIWSHPILVPEDFSGSTVREVFQDCEGWMGAGDPAGPGEEHEPLREILMLTSLLALAKEQVPKVVTAIEGWYGPQPGGSSFRKLLDGEHGWFQVTDDLAGEACAIREGLLDEFYAETLTEVED